MHNYIKQLSHVSCAWQLFFCWKIFNCFEFQFFPFDRNIFIVCKPIRYREILQGTLQVWLESVSGIFLELAKTDKKVIQMFTSRLSRVELGTLWFESRDLTYCINYAALNIWRTYLRTVNIGLIGNNKHIFVQSINCIKE